MQHVCFAALSCSFRISHLGIVLTNSNIIMISMSVETVECVPVIKAVIACRIHNQPVSFPSMLQFDKYGQKYLAKFCLSLRVRDVI